MPRLAKKLVCLTLLALSGHLAWGFALLGPINEPYQVDVIGYNIGGDIGAPKNNGEEYRRNTPTIYYSFDENFLDYFGSNGVVSIESGVAVYNALTNVSKMSPDLAEFPLQVTRENFLAEALSIEDLKSWTMSILAEQLGLAEPERFIWTLHDRFHVGNVACPVGMFYLVVQRNFDPVLSPLNMLQTSPYVNGTLYSYFISEICQGPPNTLGETIPFPVDPLDFSFTAVAGGGITFGGGAGDSSLAPGRFFTGLTRDDVGGLRYLYRTNLMHFESTGPNTLAAVTNPVPQILFTSNLTLFAQQALTNDAPTLQTLFPNLSIISSSNFFVNVLVTNVTPFFTNFPWAPAGTTVLVFGTNVVPTIQARFVHTFGNLLLVTGLPNNPTFVPLTQIPPATNTAILTIERDTVGTAADPFGPAGSVTIRTNSTFTTFFTNAPVGDIVILPTNLCSAEILGTQLTFVTKTTNFLGSFTNSLVITSSSGATNAGTILQFSISQINYFTNHAFLILPVTCVASNVALFQGIDRIRFVRRDFDSLLGRFFIPLTNSYRLNSVTNSTLVPQPILRTILGPDILFTAADLDSNPGSAVHPIAPIYARNIQFNTNFENTALAGPGTIEPSTLVTWNKGSPVFENSSPAAFGSGTAQASQTTLHILGAFDGTTNAPIIFPNGTSIENLINQVLIGISPARLPIGQVGVAYGSAFSATGGTPPYTWSLAPNSPGLPPGSFLSSNGSLGGTPTVDGTFDFTIMLTDAGGRTVDRDYSITILP